MSKKFLSLIIVPHSNKKFKTITFSEKKIKIVSIISVLLVIFLIVFLVDYFSMNVTRNNYNKLKEENEFQKKSLAQYKNLETKIRKFEEYANKLNLMAGLESPEVLKELGWVGAGNSESSRNSSPQYFSWAEEAGKINQLQTKTDILDENFSNLLDYWDSQALRLASTPTIKPTVGWISSPFGWRDDPFTGKRAFHRGLDIASAYGNPVVATADGVIAKRRHEKIGGRTIIINHKWTGYQTVYCHLSKFKVQLGQKVKRGDVVGLVGSTGKAQGPHVHYEVRRDNKSLNPYYFLLEEE